MAAGLALVLLTVSASSAAASPPSVIAGAHFWVDPSSAAAKASASFRASGDSKDADAMAKLAAQPTAVWLTSGGSTASTAANIAAKAEAAGQVPVFVTYYLPNRDCGGYSAGGAASFSAYSAWVAGIASAIGRRPAVVIIEPDAIAEMATGCLKSQAATYAAALSNEVTTFKRQPSTVVYLDAGNPSWVTDARQLSGPLQQSGLGSADGFAINVANFRTLSDDLSYGWSVSSYVNGKHFVVDTGRNGLGPLPSNSGYNGSSWCNPPGRAVGLPPTSATGHTTVDAYLWIKTPGSSDGTCGVGDPPAGTFWTSYALGLINRAAW